MAIFTKVIPDIIDLRDAVVDAQINLDLADTEYRIARMNGANTLELAPLVARQLWRTAQLREAKEHAAR